MKRDTEIVLKKIERTATLLGHDLGDWTRDARGRYSATCKKCGVTVNAKISLRTSDLTDEQCKGRAL